MRGDAVGHVQQATDAHCLERRTIREVDVQVIDSLPPPRSAGQSAERRYLLLSSPSPPLHQVAEDAQRVGPGEPGEVDELCGPPLVDHEMNRDIVRRLSVCRPGVADDVDQDAVSQAPQLANLVGDEALRKDGEGVDHDREPQGPAEPSSGTRP